ncbi:MAG: sulfurtransferase [Chloroflexi bacterium]|nr:sulfurtransferase [Chloroflexota bacterium]
MHTLTRYSVTCPRACLTVFSNALCPYPGGLPVSTPSENAFSRLVSTAWLAEHLDDPKVRVIEVSSAIEDTAYREGHVPGAAWWYWKAALWHPTDREFATSEAMAQRLEVLGVTPDTTIVLYGRPVQFGTYAFWTLSMCGHRDVRMLDGGIARWRAEGRPLSAETPIFTPAAYAPTPRDESSRMGRDDVRAGLGRPGRLLLDVRTPEEYSGQRVTGPGGFDHGAERAGRIPGAVHLFFRELLNEDDTFKDPQTLRRLLAGVGIRDPRQDVVVYCRLSHRATLAWFAMRYLLGYQDVKVYDGSWTEWGSIVGFPVER